MRSVSPRLYAAVLLSACLQLLPFPITGPVPDWRRLLSWFCLLPLLYALSEGRADGRPLSIRQSAWLGYGCGVAWFAGNCYWIYQTMFLYGGLPKPVAFGILLLFSLYLGLYFALFGAGFAVIQRRKGTVAALCLSPLLWVAVELARDRLTGFPWDLLGYTQIDNTLLTSLVPWTGVMGLSLVVAGANVLWFWQPKVRGRRLLAGPVCVLLIMGASYLRTKYPHYRPEIADASAILVQDNLNVGAQAGPPETQPELLQSLTGATLHPQLPHLSSDLSLSGGQENKVPLQLVAWPEAPTPFASADPNFRTAISQLARTVHAPVVVDAVAGADRPNPQGHYDEYVSASFFLPDGSYAGRYDKMHLVPFGEYTPYKPLFFFAGHLLDGLNFVPGTQRNVFSVGRLRYGVFLCYESIFGDEVRQFTLGGAQVLVNLTVDGCYADTSAPWEHLDMARMRALENSRWLLRDTNTGLTASIDPQGRVVASMPRHVRGAVQVPFSYRSRLTFYTRHGDWIAEVCTLLIAAVLLGEALQRRFPYLPVTSQAGTR